MNALSKTYAKTKTKSYRWYQQTERSESNWGLQLFKEDDHSVGEGCYLHVLQRRASYGNQGSDLSKDDIISNKIASFEDTLNKKIAANNDKIKGIETKLDEFLKTLSATVKK